MNNKKSVKNFDPTDKEPSYLLSDHIIKDETSKPLPLLPIPSAFSYLSAFLIVLSITIFQLSVLPEPAIAPFVFFFPAVSSVAFLGGFLPGLLAVIFSALAANFFFIKPYWSWSISFDQLMATFLFIVSSLTLVLLSVYFRKVLINLKRAIKDRQKAEANVIKANEEWNRTFDAISDFTFIQDKDFRIVRVNRALAEILNLKPEEIIGKKCYEVMHKSDKPWVNCPFEKTRSDMTPHTEEVLDPAISLPLLVTTSPILSQEGEFIGSIHIAKDITELKLAEEKIRETSDYLNKLLKYANAPVIVWNPQGEITLFNRAFEKLTGYSANEVIGQKLEMLFPQESKQQSLKSIAKTAKGEYWEAVEIPIRLKEGEVRIVLWNSANIFSANGAALTATIAQGQDITERKRAEAALAKNEESMKRAQEIAHLGSWELDLTNNNLTWSDEVYRIFGLKPQEFSATYEAFLDAVHPDDRKLVDAAYSESISQGKDDYEIEHRVVKKLSGETRLVYEKCRHIRDKTGRIIRSIGMVHDITERKFMEERLRLEMTKAEALLTSIGDSIVAIDVEGKILFTNQAFAELVKKDRDDLLGKSLDAIAPLEDEKGSRLIPDLRPIFLTMSSGKKISLNLFPQIYYLRQDGNLIPLAITATPVVSDDKTIGAIAVYRDITREKAIDQAKTEFVSLASHQLRTPLSSIALSTELLLRGVAGEISSEQKKYLNEAYNSTKIMAELIKVLLDISRIELGTFMVQFEPLNLAERIDYMLDELKLQLSSKKLILRKNYKISPIIQFDKNILRTTIENLITNAIRYTGDGGTIFLSLEENAKEILIKISDTGCGIPEKDKDKVFTKLFRAENALKRGRIKAPPFLWPFPKTAKLYKFLAVKISRLIISGLFL
ncbi:PAS domain S-box protein [Candidatus Falkowbacteria bacterium]|nr:PAS domain S-box protein [Candidatus Falkowbacteria bacterium]